MLSLEVEISAWKGAGMMTTMTNTETSTGMGPFIKKLHSSPQAWFNQSLASTHLFVDVTQQCDLMFLLCICKALIL